MKKIIAGLLILAVASTATATNYDTTLGGDAMLYASNTLRNVSIGRETAKKLRYGSDNIVIGNGSLSDTFMAFDNIFIGNNLAQNQEQVFNCIQIGGSDNPERRVNNSCIIGDAFVSTKCYGGILGIGCDLSESITNSIIMYKGGTLTLNADRIEGARPSYYCDLGRLSTSNYMYDTQSETFLATNSSQVVRTYKAKCLGGTVRYTVAKAEPYFSQPDRYSNVSIDWDMYCDYAPITTNSYTANLGSRYVDGVNTNTYVVVANVLSLHVVQNGRTFTVTPIHYTSENPKIAYTFKNPMSFTLPTPYYVYTQRIDIDKEMDYKPKDGNENRFVSSAGIKRGIVSDINTYTKGISATFTNITKRIYSAQQSEVHFGMFPEYSDAIWSGDFFKGIYLKAYQSDYKNQMSATGQKTATNSYYDVFIDGIVADIYALSNGTFEVIRQNTTIRGPLNGTATKTLTCYQLREDGVEYYGTINITVKSEEILFQGWKLDVKIDFYDKMSYRTYLGGIISGRPYIFPQTVSAGQDYFMDEAVNYGCVSSTKYVDNRLGGLSLKLESGQISVYQGNTKLGTLQMTASP